MAMRTLGYGKVFQDERGNLIVDRTTIKRGTRVSGEDDVGGFRPRRRRRHDDFDEDDLGDEDIGDEDSDDFGDEDVGDDDLGEDDLGEDDLGDEIAGRRGKRRRSRRRSRRASRKENRQERRESRKEGDVKWGKTALAGESNTPDDVGDQITITIRPQHWFKASDITFTGDSAAKIDTIFFGERPVWNNSSGVPVSVFSSTGMLRGLLAGQKIRPGLDIVIKGTAGTASTTTTATVIGYKPLNTSC